jgi:hypothetical protein
VHGVEIMQGSSSMLFTAGLASLAIASGGMAIGRKPCLGVLLTSLGALALLVLLAKALKQSPTLTLAVLLGMLSAVFWLWRHHWLAASLHIAATPTLEARTRLAALTSPDRFWCLDSFFAGHLGFRRALAGPAEDAAPCACRVPCRCRVD